MGGRLQDKVVIITGSGRGIGRACALTFAREGARVVVNDLDAASAEETTRLVREGGGVAIPHPADVRVASEVDDLVQAAVDAHGRLDVMFANAGGALPEPTLGVSDEAYREVVALNQDGVFFCVRAALRVMVPRVSGVVLATTSGAGLGAVGGLAVYGMAKAGVANLIRSVAEEYGPRGIRANAISPGPIASEAMRAFLDGSPGLRAQMEEGVPVRRLGDPQDIANAAVFLASDEARYVTGVVLPVDGGIAARYPAPSLDAGAGS